MNNNGGDFITFYEINILTNLSTYLIPYTHYNINYLENT